MQPNFEEEVGELGVGKYRKHEPIWEKPRIR